MKAKQIIGIVGAALLVVGIFLPAIKIPFLGNTTYFENQEFESYAMVGMALLTMILIALKKDKGLWFTGLCSFGVLVYSYFQFQGMMNGENAQMENDFGALYKEFSGMLQEVVQLQWGIGILLMGSVLIILAALLKGKI